MEVTKDKKLVELDSSCVEHSFVDRALKDRGCCERALRTYLYHGPNCSNHGRDPVPTTERIKLPSKEDAVIDSTGVSERKLALEIAKLEKESKQQMKLLTREANELRKIGRDVRRHSFETNCICSKLGGKLPPIHGPHDCSQEVSNSSLGCPSPEHETTSSAWGKQSSADSLISRNNLTLSESHGKASLSSRKSPKLHHSSSLPDTLNVTPSITIEDTCTNKVTTVLRIADDNERSLQGQCQRCISHADCHSKSLIGISHFYNRRARTPEELRRSKNICHLVRPNVSHRISSPNRLELKNSQSRSRSSLDPRFQRLESVLVPIKAQCVVRQDAEDYSTSKSSDVGGRPVSRGPLSRNHSDKCQTSEKDIITNSWNTAGSTNSPRKSELASNLSRKQDNGEIYCLTVGKDPTRQKPDSIHVQRGKSKRDNGISNEIDLGLSDVSDSSPRLRSPVTPRLSINASGRHPDTSTVDGHAKSNVKTKRCLMKRQKAQSSSCIGGMSPRTMKRVSFKTSNMCDDTNLESNLLHRKQDRRRSNTH